MICKLIACGPDRAAAIATMREALDALRDPRRVEQPRVPGGAARAPALRRRRLHDGFIAEEYAKGFALPAPGADHDELVAIAIGRQPPPARPRGRPHRPAARPRGRDRRGLRRRRGRCRGQDAAHLGRCALDGAELVVTIAGRARRVSFETPVRDIAARGSLDGAPFHAQIERLGLGLRVARHGSADRRARALAARRRTARADAVQAAARSLAASCCRRCRGCSSTWRWRPGRRCAPASAWR